VDFALDVLGRLDLEGEVGIRICSSRSMSALNRRFRGKVGPTDVLSFRDGTPQPGGEVYLGDIVIAAPVAATAAKEEGVPFEVELKRLLLHGILHLAGYDHEADSGAMRRKERDLRRGWGIA
jgi:probable rRNA maturation factor